MRIQGGGETEVVFKTKENVLFREAPESTGFCVKRFEDPVFLFEAEVLPGKSQSLERGEV